MKGFAHRAVMLDLSRVLEKKAYYRGLLPWFRKWGYNAVHLHFADDQGSALVFPSHPELAKDGAFTAEEMGDFISAAQTEGLTVIPEIETLGHTQFITTHAAYAHLGGDGSGHFNALDPQHPESIQLLQELLQDVADIFPGDLIHLGLDEVNLSCLPRFKSVADEEHWRTFAKHAARMHDMVRQLGRRPAMWGDHILSTPEMLEQFEKDVLIFDWHYEHRIDPASLGFFCERNFEVWACPATSSWLYTRGLPNADNIANLRHFSAVAALYREQGVTGMVNTVWCPWRYLPGGADWPMALGGHLFSAEKEDPRFATEFAGAFYGFGSDRAEAVGRAVSRLHEVMMSRPLIQRLWSDATAEDPFTRDDLRVCNEKAQDVASLLDTLCDAAECAEQNRERLHDLVITGRFLQMLTDFGRAKMSTRTAGDDRYKLAVSELLNACCAAWERERHERWDSPTLVNNGDSIINLVRRLSPNVTN